MEQKKARPNAEDVARKGREHGKTSSDQKSKLNDKRTHDEDRIDDGAAIANDHLNSANDE